MRDRPGAQVPANVKGRSVREGRVRGKRICGTRILRGNSANGTQSVQNSLRNQSEFSSLPSHFGRFATTRSDHKPKFIPGSEKPEKAKMPVGGRVAGKIGYISNSGNDRSYTGINEEIIWTCIGMSITIAVLITMALCYIAREKCRKRNEYYISA